MRTPSKVKPIQLSSDGISHRPALQTQQPSPSQVRSQQNQEDLSSRIRFIDTTFARKPLNYRGDDDINNLHQLYNYAFGEEDGKKGAETVLNDPRREICPPHQSNTKYMYDRFDVPGVKLLWSQLRRPNSHNEGIYHAYRQIPTPGVAYLSEQSRGILLHRFAKPRRARRIDLTRLVCVIDDMQRAGLKMSWAVWMSAINLSGKFSLEQSSYHLQEALKMWRRMEHEGKMPSTSVTLNILFDISAKSGLFKVGEKVANEMKSRGISFSRCGKVSHIFLAGLRNDPAGVRAAYKDFVDSGEIVDTVVLNCTIASLVRCGQYPVAEKMYQRMTDARKIRMSEPDHRSTLPLIIPSVSDNFAAYRKATVRLGRVLGASAVLHDKNRDFHQKLQSLVPLTPDSRTFHIFLSYHVYETGDLKKFLQFVDDMEDVYRIPPQGMIYNFLFQGFIIHGGKHGPWTLNRLKEVWRTFLRAVDRSQKIIAQKTKVKKGTLTVAWENPLRKKPTKNKKRTPQSQSQTPPKAQNGHQENVTHGFQGSSDFHDREEMEGWRYENIVFLGSTIVIKILHAFNSCGGPDAVIEVWGQIERNWKVESLQMGDIRRVDIELTKILSGRSSRE